MTDKLIDTPPDTQGALDAINRITDKNRKVSLPLVEIQMRGGGLVKTLQDIIDAALTRPSREARLLEALKNSLECILNDYHTKADIDLARQAIAEAEGE